MGWGEVVETAKLLDNWASFAGMASFIQIRHCQNKSHREDSSGGSRKCKRRGRKPHFGCKKGVLASLYSKNAWKCNIFTKKGGGRTPGTSYAGTATGFQVCTDFKVINHWQY